MSDFFFLLLKKKQIYITLLVIIIIIFVMLYLRFFCEKETVEVISLPATNKTIILDAGHRISGWRSSVYKWSI